MSKEILITGASGFVGSHLEKRLQSNDNYSVTTLDRKTTPLTKDVDLQKTLDKVEYVIHLAGLTRGSDSEMCEANLLSTVVLLEALNQLKHSPKIIFASSFGVYASSDHPIDEDSPLAPRGVYGLTKKWAEEAIKHAHDTKELHAVILRFSNVYGDGMPPNKHSVVANFIDKIKKEEPLTVTGDGTQMRDFVFVDDVVDAILNSIEKEDLQDFQIFNICSGRGISLTDLANLIGETVGVEPTINFVEATNPDGNWIGNNNRAKKELDWIPKTKLEEGLLCASE